jgi:hypothetical protein
MNACPKCPCPDICLGRLEGWSGFCDLAGAEPPDPVALAHICRRSATAAEFPPLATQARTLAAALWEWATSGFTVADEAEVARRLAICRGCPNWRDGRCAICGCALAWKVRMRTEHCPIDQW